jgi:UDP-4-amino-4,6-dideoxy-N-acetyl-beta-L-altrosamine transaminase
MKSKFFPYGKQYIDQQDIDAVTSALTSSNLTQGPAVESFEQNFAAYVGAKYAITFNSATSALHSVNVANNITKHDICVVPANTFVATANSYEYLGANVRLIDIDPNTRNLDIRQLEHLASTTKVHSVTCVHYAGTPINMNEVRSLSLKFDFKVIEDACHAIGSTQHDGQPVGKANFSDACTFSFHPVKGMTTGEGGMVTTNDHNLYKRLLKLRSHGINKTADELQNKSKNIWYYEQQELGFNYRMTDISAALGNSQLQKLSDFVSKRRQLALNYDRIFSQFEHISPICCQYRDVSSHHLYVIDIPFATLGIDKNTLMLALRKLGIGTQVHYIPIYKHPYFMGKYNNDPINFPNTEQHYRDSLSIPLYYELDYIDQEFIANTINNTILNYV